MLELRTKIRLKIHVERDAKPRFFKARSVPLAYIRAG